MQEDILKVLFTEEDIQVLVRKLAKQVERDYKGRNPLMICILKARWSS